MSGTASVKHAEVAVVEETEAAAETRSAEGPVSTPLQIEPTNIYYFRR